MCRAEEDPRPAIRSIKREIGLSRSPAMIATSNSGRSVGNTPHGLVSKLKSEHKFALGSGAILNKSSNPPNDDIKFTALRR